MKKATLIASALVCAYLLTAGIAPAQTSVAGFSPNFADPQPVVKGATLTEDANRLIRWQGWMDVDAFSASVLEQMQKQLENGGIETGKFTLAERSVFDAVQEAKAKDTSFVMNDRLSAEGESITDVKLYVWTYRHNFTDTGLYQLYVSAKAKVLIGKGYGRGPGQSPVAVRHKDIQSLGYEFGSDGVSGGGDGEVVVADRYATIEIWRGAVVRVNAKGVIEVVGNEAGAVTIDGGVEKAPIVAWERAPSLEGKPSYDPKAATGAEYVLPLDHEVKVPVENSVQKRAGDVQAEKRVQTVSPFRLRSR
jgi:hypothetical protein